MQHVRELKHWLSPSFQEEPAVEIEMLEGTGNRETYLLVGEIFCDHWILLFANTGKMVPLNDKFFYILGNDF